MNGRIAFFDFDGTITTRDTLLEFFRYCKGTIRFYLGFLLNSPWLIAYKLKIISNQKAKERVLTHFFRNCPLAAFQEQCDRFATEMLPRLIRAKAGKEIALLQEQGFTVVIVSASPENWIRSWAEKVGALLIATRLETREGVITGKIAGNNCHGKEKVRRIKEAYALPDYRDIYAYGDTGGDKPMLALATISFFRPFR
jgi:HAD superfamily hydrolase (TIGR01490 family)